MLYYMFSSKFSFSHRDAATDGCAFSSFLVSLKNLLEKEKH